MPGILHLVVDTNLFHECHKLDDPNFPWSAIGDFHTIELIVPGPVQAELDQHKKDTRPRLKRRALLAVAWFRDMLTQSQEEKVLRDADPRVTLRLDATPKSSEHTDVLDYDIADDRIVGVAAAVAAAAPGDDVRLLTHDTGPAMKAKTVGLPFLLIPDQWRREEEEDEVQKENKRLREELRRLQSASPVLKVAANNIVDQKVRLERKAYAGLSDSELEAFKEGLHERFPISRLVEVLGGPPERPGSGSILGQRDDAEYVEPTPAALERYRDVTYPGWIDQCVENIRLLPRRLNLQIPAEELTINLLNDGSRPAENVLIKFVARGPFLIAPPPYNGERPELHLEPLPEPPVPPRGNWTRSGLSFATPISIEQIGPDFASLERFNRNNFQRDDDRFYFDPERPKEPVAEFSLTCRHFRHGLGPDTFAIEIFPKTDGASVRGSIQVHVHASNLGEPIEETIPIEVVTEERPIEEHVDKLIDMIQLLPGTKPRKTRFDL